jgi:hypothetical protein
MAFRFRKRFKIFPGIKVTLSKRSIGVTAGVRGAHLSINTKGRITRTVGLPGSGLSDVNISQNNKEI